MEDAEDAEDEDVCVVVGACAFVFERDEDGDEGDKPAQLAKGGLGVRVEVKHAGNGVEHVCSHESGGL